MSRMWVTRNQKNGPGSTSKSFHLGLSELFFKKLLLGAVQTRSKEDEDQKGQRSQVLILTFRSEQLRLLFWRHLEAA